MGNAIARRKLLRRLKAPPDKRDNFDPVDQLQRIKVLFAKGAATG